MAFFQNKKDDPVTSEAPSTPPTNEARGTKEGEATPLTIGDDIFQGLGENFFKDVQTTQANKPKKKDPYEIGAKAFDIGMKIAIVLTVIFSIDSTLRNQEEPGFLENLPVCNYLALGISDFSNDECKTLVQISADKTEEKKQVETTLVSNLLVLVPKRLEAGDALNSPEVQFIKERTGDARVSFATVVDEFQSVIAKSDYRGEDIECLKFVFNEKGEFSVRCEFYGDSLNSSAFRESRSSRMTALAFLERLENSPFKVLNSPKTLDIQKYSTADVGIRSTFSTVTKLQLSLRYVPTATGNRP